MVLHPATFSTYSDPKTGKVFEFEFEPIKSFSDIDTYMFATIGGWADTRPQKRFALKIPRITEKAFSDGLFRETNFLNEWTEDSNTMEITICTDGNNNFAKLKGTVKAEYNLTPMDELPGDGSFNPSFNQYLTMNVTESSIKNGNTDFEIKYPFPFETLTLDYTVSDVNTSTSGKTDLITFVQQDTTKSWFENLKCQHISIDKNYNPDDVQYELLFCGERGVIKTTFEGPDTGGNTTTQHGYAYGTLSGDESAAFFTENPEEGQTEGEKWTIAHSTEKQEGASYNVHNYTLTNTNDNTKKIELQWYENSPLIATADLLELWGSLNMLQ